MSAHRVRLGVAVALIGIALAAGCSSNHDGGSAQKLLGPGGRVSGAENGLDLTASPVTIVINPADPSTPSDPNHGNERYGTAALLAVATDENGAPQPGLGLTLATTAGVLASGGVPAMTDAQGLVTDSLRIYESDPGQIQVSVTDGTRTTTIVVTKVVSAPAVSDAGPDQIVECTGDSSAQVTLDASGTTDPNNDIATYEWFEHYGAPEQVLLDRGRSVEVVLPLGEHVITLVVTDSTGATSTDEVLVTVADTRPPVVRLALSPSRLWPPNHKLVHVTADLRVIDCGSYTVTLESVRSSEPDNGLGDGDTAGDIQGAELGTEDYEFDLRAERAGGGSGRFYTVVYRVVDAGGLETIARARVTVPHDQGNR